MMNKTSCFIRTTRTLALGAVACMAVACSPDNDPQPSLNNNSPTTVNPATQTPPPPTPSSPQTMDDRDSNQGMDDESGMNNENGMGDDTGMDNDTSMSYSSSSVPVQETDTDRGVGTVPPTTYSD